MIDSTPARRGRLRGPRPPRADPKDSVPGQLGRVHLGQVGEEEEDASRTPSQYAGLSGAAMATAGPGALQVLPHGER